MRGSSCDVSGCGTGCHGSRRRAAAAARRARDGRRATIARARRGGAPRARRRCAGARRRPAGVISTTTTRASSASPATRSTKPSSSSWRTWRPVDAASMPVARASSPRGAGPCSSIRRSSAYAGRDRSTPAAATSAGVPVAAGPQPVELLERPLGTRPDRPPRRPYITCLNPATSPQTHLAWLTRDIRRCHAETVGGSVQGEALADEVLGEGPEAGGRLGVAGPGRVLRR